MNSMRSNWSLENNVELSYGLGLDPAYDISSPSGKIRIEKVFLEP